MHKAFTVVVIVASACLLAAEPGVDVTGNWAGVISGQDGGKGSVRFVLKQAGDQVSGTAGPSDKQNLPQLYDGKLEGNHLTFAVDDADENGLKLTYHFDLTVTGDRILGKADGRSGDRSWTMDVSVTRQK
jgi:hypothetical protein